MSFVTEKEVEQLLESETRWITLPCRNLRPFTTTKLIWAAHDYVVAWGDFTPEQIVELAAIDGRETNRSFELSYPHTIGYIHNAYRKCFGDVEPRRS